MAGVPNSRSLRSRLAPWGLLLLLGLTACEPAASAITPGAGPTAATPSPPPTEQPSPTTATTPTPSPAPTATTTPGPTPTPAIRGDFGDAPDGLPAGYGLLRVVGRFPTRLRTGSSDGPGAHIRHPGLELLGRRVTLEGDADDAADSDLTPNLVNADGADDGVLGLTVRLDAQPLRARLQLEVTLAAAAPLGPRYLNVLIDMNRDGRWSGTPDGVPEWAVRNWRIRPLPGRSVELQSDPFAIGDGPLLPDGAWMRVLLTREPIEVPDWDGSGSWEHGEVEDYQIALPRQSAADGDGPPQALPVLLCPAQVTFSDAELMAGFSCTVTNAAAGGAFEARIVRAAGLSRLLPAEIPLQTLRTGASRTLGFVLIRQDTPSRWRYRTQIRDLESSAEAGIVSIGISDSDRTIAADVADPGEKLYWTDAEADYFSIVSRVGVDGFGFADIRRVAVGRARLDAASIDILRQELPVIGEADPARISDEYVVVIVEMSDRIPLDESSLGFQVSFVVQANDDPKDDWEPQVRTFDLFQGTDQWYEVIYRPSLDPPWRLQRRGPNDPGMAVPTGAQAFIIDKSLLLLVPSVEFARASQDLRYRVTTFVHEPDDPTGIEKPSMADAFPELEHPLADFGRVVVPKG